MATAKTTKKKKTVKVAFKKASARRTAPKASVAKAAVKKAPPAAAAKPAAGIGEQVAQLLYRQAEALDTKQWQAFIDLFTADGVYWAPTDPKDTHWDGRPSIFTEDRDLMTVRMKRIQHPNAWSQQAEWGTNHVIGNVTIERIEKNGDVHTRARFHMAELRRDDLRHFAGTYRHHLVKTPAGYRIKAQRVDLLNAQAPFEYVLQAWV